MILLGDWAPGSVRCHVRLEGACTLEKAIAKQLPKPFKEFDLLPNWTELLNK